ncbi:hypothetical protein JDV09_26220 [Mycobacterium sp. Y57]|uniref:hypothetical protein n=1 Tax=Mycolicibacterium xanthum TaxID=2796469 RepID=UPI001C84C906|nr:hypothetical protein [Mycolicibacterium xanthum]MBX7435559.1 hypothetical protein [Mycolicibacterium xanthum]
MFRTVTISHRYGTRSFLPEQVRRLPEKLARADKLLNNLRSSRRSWRNFDLRIGHPPSTPMETHLRSMFLLSFRDRVGL